MSEELILGGMTISRPKPLTVASGSEQGFTLMSDLHIGAPHVDYKLIEHELKQAKEKGDRILVNGDVFDAILPKDHKRFAPDALHPRLQGRNNILNEAVKWATEIFEPYVDSIDMMGMGNHDTAVERYHSFDPVLLLIYELEKKKKKADHIIHHGVYTGFIDYRLQKKGNGHGSYRWLIWYHHGTGGGAPVTRGMIDLHRTGWVDADLIWMGHKHVRVASNIMTLHCPLSGDEPYLRDVRQVITGAYFDTYRGQSQKSVREHGRRSNYAADSGRAPQGKGGARIVVTPRPSNNQPYFDVKVIQ